MRIYYFFMRLSENIFVFNEAREKEPEGKYLIQNLNLF